MAEVNEKLVAAWQEASQDLGIAVTAPYTIHTSGRGMVRCGAYIPDFGSPTGAFAINSRTRREARPLLRKANHWHSEMSYLRYDRRVFIEMLND